MSGAWLSKAAFARRVSSNWDVLLRTQQSWNLNGSAWICMDVYGPDGSVVQKYGRLWQCIVAYCFNQSALSWKLPHWEPDQFKNSKFKLSCGLTRLPWLPAGEATAHWWRFVALLFPCRPGQVRSSRVKSRKMEFIKAMWCQFHRDIWWDGVFIAFPMRFIFIQYFIHLFPFSAWHIQCVLHPQVLLSQAKTFQELGLPRRAREEQAWNENQDIPNTSQYIIYIYMYRWIDR